MKDWRLRDRIGTALAFLSQISFTASIFLAYTQYLWRQMRDANQGGKYVKVKNVNDLFSLDVSMLAFLNRDLWTRRFSPVLGIALIAWYFIFFLV